MIVPGVIDGSIKADHILSKTAFRVGFHGWHYSRWHSHSQNGNYDESLSTKNLTVRETLLVKDIDIQGDLISLTDGKILVRELHVENKSHVNYLNATRISVLQELKSDRIYGEHMMITNISTTESVISKGIITSNIHVIDDGKIKSEKVTSSLLRASSIFVNGSATVVGPIELYGDLVINVSSQGPSNIVGVGKIGSKEVIVESGVKARSFFGTRMYTRDLAASGFISAETFIGKGSMDVSGTITGTKMNVTDRLSASTVAVENHMRCSTMEVKSNLEAGGITTKKITVKGDIVVNGINIHDKLDEIEDLKKRIAHLESILEKSISV